MQKLLFKISVILLFTLGISSCSQDDEENTTEILIGEWELVTCDVNTGSNTLDFITQYGDEDGIITLRITDDSYFEFNASLHDDPHSGSWSLKRDAEVIELITIYDDSNLNNIETLDLIYAIFGDTPGDYWDLELEITFLSNDELNLSVSDDNESAYLEFEKL